MCANFQPISPTQAPLFTNQQLSFDVKQDIYPGYEAPLLFANLLSNTSGDQPCLEWCLNGRKILLLPNTPTMPVVKRSWINQALNALGITTSLRSFRCKPSLNPNISMVKVNIMALNARMVSPLP